MADGRLTLELDSALAARLVTAAEQAGRPVHDYATAIIGEALDDEWSEAGRRWAEYQKTGEAIDLADAMAELRAGLVAHRQARR